MSKYKRRWNPTCYVCSKRIQELHDMKKLKEELEKAPTRIIEKQIEALANRIPRSVVCVGEYKNGTKMMRHGNGYCEPGGDNYMRNPELAKSWRKTCSTM